MNNKLNKTKLGFYLIITIILTLGLSISLQSILADWVPPTATAPANNVAAPINTGTTGQQKAGPLIVNVGGSADSVGFVVDNGKVGIGTTIPGAKLEIKGGAGERGLIINTLSSAPSSAPAGIILGNNYSTETYQMYTDYTNGFRIHRSSNSSGNDFRMDSTGNIGIGKTPSTKLDVDGTVTATNFVGNGSGLTNLSGTIPSHAVMAFNQATCPIGWHELTALRGRTVVGAGTGSGLTARAMNATGGEESHRLTLAEAPSHTHTVNVMGGGSSYGWYGTEYINGAMVNVVSTPAGGDGYHNNMQPFYALLYCEKD